MLGEHAVDGRLVGFGGGGAKGERYVAQAKVEQAIAVSGLAVVVALWRCAREDLDLPVVESEAAIDRRDLWLGGSVVGLLG